MDFCENCGIKHDSSYASGRFCSLKCSRSFSTKAKRSEINSKVSHKLTKIKTYKSCVICNTKFIAKRKTCSSECNSKLLSISQLGKAKKRGDNRKKGSGGLRDGGGRSKVYEYVSLYGDKMKLNNDEIQIAKILDDSGLKWKRNTTGFKYTNERCFYPDFYIIDLDIYVEYKGWLVDHMREKMKKAKELNTFNLIIVVSDRFKNDGVTIEDFVTLLKTMKKI